MWVQILSVRSITKWTRTTPETVPRSRASLWQRGDAAGMGADLFGSFAEATCALEPLLRLTGTQRELDCDALSFHISGAGICARIVTTLFALFGSFLDRSEGGDQGTKTVFDTLENQLWISTIIMTPSCVHCLVHFPKMVLHQGRSGDRCLLYSNWFKCFICAGLGLWGGLVIWIFTEYMTSYEHAPTQEVASHITGAATNIIFGLALGYKSCIVPIFVLALCVFTSFTLADMFGIALCALGMLSTLSVGLSIDAYGPITDNAGGMAEMSGMDEAVRTKTDVLDAAGNTTAAIGKGFAIGLPRSFLSPCSVPSWREVRSRVSTFFNRLAFVLIARGCDASVLVHCNDCEVCRHRSKGDGVVCETYVGQGETSHLQNGCEGKCHVRSGHRHGTVPRRERSMFIPPRSWTMVISIVSPFVLPQTHLWVRWSHPVHSWCWLPSSRVTFSEFTQWLDCLRVEWRLVFKWLFLNRTQVELGTMPKSGSRRINSPNSWLRRTPPRARKSTAREAIAMPAGVGDTVGDPCPALNILMKLMAIVSLVFALFFPLTRFVPRSELAKLIVFSVVIIIFQINANVIPM